MEELWKITGAEKQENIVTSINKNEKQTGQNLVIKLSEPGIGKVRTQEVMKVFLQGTVEG